MFQKRLGCKPGFTFAEMMVVIMIIGILSAVIIPSYFSWVERAKKRKVETVLQTISAAIKTYHMDTNHWPGTLDDLVRKPFDERIASRWAKGGYLETADNQVPEDPWGNDYVYKRTPGAKNPYEIYSYGPDGQESEDEDWIRA